MAPERRHQLVVSCGEAVSRSAKARPARPPGLPQQERDEARACWAERVAEAAPNLALEGEGLLSRLSPDRWTLEWSLPYWLGQTLRLTRDDWLGLAVSNLLGLGFIRLADDLVDDEPSASAPGASRPARPAAVLLSATLQHLWIRSLRQQCGAEPRFWNWFDACMQQWQAATWASLRPPATPFAEFSPADFLALGQRGAPVKVCVAGACLLAGQFERTADIAVAVDDLLTGAVLLDQANDWEEDLAHGRANVFVSYVLGAAAHGAEATPTQRSVSAGLLAGEGARPFFAKTRQQLTSAAGKAQQAGVIPLAEFACWLEGQAEVADQDLRRAVRGAHRAAGARLRATASGQ